MKRQSDAHAVRPLAERDGESVGSSLRTKSSPRSSRLYGDIEDVRQILLDVDRTSARLVVNPARVVVAETRRSFAYLSLYGVATDAVLINRVLPARAADGYFAHWAEHEQRELLEIERSFPIPQFRVPLHPSEPIGVDALRRLARIAFGDTDPAALLTRSRPIRLSKRNGRLLLEIELHNAAPGEVDVSAHGAELLVRVRDFQRSISLPASVAGRPVATVSLEKGVLAVTFDERGGPSGSPPGLHRA